MSDERRVPGDLGTGAAQSIAVTKSDTVDLDDDSRGIICDADGTIKCTFVNDADGTFVTISVLAGVLYPFRLKRVWLATTPNVIALW